MAIADGQSLVVLLLELQGESFAIETDKVREILDPGQITTVPGADPSVDGLINVRGRVVPLADLRLIFGMQRQPEGPDARIVVIEVEIEGDPVTIGIKADRVSEVTELPAASLETTPQTGMQWRPDYFLCIGKRGADVIMVLDVASIFARRGTGDATAPPGRQSAQAAAA